TGSTRTTCPSRTRSRTSRIPTRDTWCRRNGPDELATRHKTVEGPVQPAGPSAPAEGGDLTGRRLIPRRRVILGAAAAVLCTAALLLGGVLHDSAPASSTVAPQAPPAQASAQPLTNGLGTGDTEALVAKLQATLRTNPNDVTSLDSLALAYQQRARETGDPTYYTKSGEVLHRVLQLVPEDLVATSALGSLALSRHRFAEALVLGRRAHA